MYNHFYTKRCNHCQKYGHYLADCKSVKPVCGHCSKEHETTTCPNTNRPPTCINCVLSNISDTNHKASDIQCPSYKNAQNKLRNSIMYYSKN